MTELAPIDNYQGSEPELVVFNIGQQLFTNQYTVFTTSGNSLWRLRVLTVAGGVTGTAVTVRLGLGLQVTAQAGRPWTNPANDSAITATVPQDIPVPAGPFFNYTWSTETTSAYFSNDDSQGFVAQAGIPLAFLPAPTNLSLICTRSAGGDGGFNVQDGFIQIEKFPLSAISAGGTDSDQRVYLLQAAKPGDAGAFA